MNSGQQLGPYTKDEIIELLSTGAFMPTDLAWCESSADWEPLSQLVPMPPPVEVPVEAPAKVPVETPFAPPPLQLPTAPPPKSPGSAESLGGVKK